MGIMCNEGFMSNISEISVSTTRDYCCNESDTSACCIYTSWLTLNSMARSSCGRLEDSCQSQAVSHHHRSWRFRFSGIRYCVTGQVGPFVQKEHRVFKMLGITHSVTQLYILADLLKQWHEGLSSDFTNHAAQPGHSGTEKLNCEVYCLTLHTVT
jgi:hypothetical protein